MTSTIGVVTLLGIVGCADQPRGILPTAPTSSSTAGGKVGLAVPQEYSSVSVVPVDAGNFPALPRIDNQWLPLTPGTQFVLQGTADRGGGILPHRIVTTVTDLTKEINGVHTLVMLDKDFNTDQLAEAELAFHAQDNSGNVWNFGEYPEEYENGQFVGAPSTWIAGLASAEAGILMLASPRVGDKYIQGSAPEIGFLDYAKVLRTGQSTCVPFDCYSNVLLIDESSPLEPGSGHQRKYHAPGVGVVQVGAVGDKEAETLVLIDIVHLGAQGLREARREALRLEKRAYEVSGVYRLTTPCSPLPAGPS